VTARRQVPSKQGAVADLEIERVLERRGLLSVQDLRLDTVSIDKPQRMPVTLGLELAQLPMIGAKADTARDEHDAFGSSAGQGEIPMRAIQIGAGSDRDGADPIGEMRPIAKLQPASRSYRIDG